MLAVPRSFAVLLVSLGVVNGCRGENPPDAGVAGTPGSLSVAGASAAGATAAAGGATAAAGGATAAAGGDAAVDEISGGQANEPALGDGTNKIDVPLVPDGHGFDVGVALASEYKDRAPGTVGIVTWSLADSDVVEAHIDFGLDATYGMTAPVDLAAESHRTLLLGMKPSHTYHFRISASDGNTTRVSDDHVLTTGALPRSLVPFKGMQVYDDAARERGFILLSYWNGEGAEVPFIIDADGDIVWWYESDVGGIGHAVMSATGKNLWLVHTSNEGAPLERITLDTLETQSYPNTVGSHDITPVTGETMAYVDYGLPVCDAVIEIDPSGTTHEVFESQTVFPSARCHGNAVRYSTSRDAYTYSDRFYDILMLDRSGNVLWSLADVVPGGNASWGGSQHGNQLLDDSILVFANQGAGSSASRVIEYALTGEERSHYDGRHFSYQMGDVQRLPGGNTLVTYSNDSVIQEVTPAGKVVMELDGGGSYFGYSLWRPTLYGPPPNIE